MTALRRQRPNPGQVEDQSVEARGLPILPWRDFPRLGNRTTAVIEPVRVWAEATRVWGSRGEGEVLTGEVA